MQRFGWVALVTLGLSGCFSSPSDRAAGNPLALIRKDADTVIEFRDIAMLAALRATAGERFAPALSKADVSALQDALALFLGFDPMTADGLKSVGLATIGPVAGELLADGTGAVWAIPVVDPKKFAPVLASAIETRWGADESKTETKDGVSFTTMSMEFGPHRAVRAAYGHRQRHMIVGFGPKAAELVSATLRRAKADTVESNQRFVSMRKRLQMKPMGSTKSPTSYDVRAVSLRGGTLLATAAKKATRRLPSLVAQLSQGVEAMGWVARYEEGVVRAVGQVLLNEKGLSLARKVLTTQQSAPPGVRALHLPRALVTAQMAGDPQALVDAVAPEGSRLRAQMGLRTESLKQDFGIDLLGDVLPNLSGHAAFSLGIKDLSRVEFETLISAPESLVWAAFAASAKDAASIGRLESKLEGRLKEWQAKVVKRKVDSSEIRDIVPTDAQALAASAPLFSTFTHGRAWGFSVDPQVAQAIVDNKSDVDLLAKSAGLQVDVRFDRLRQQLDRFRMGQIPLLYRALVAKALGYLSLLDRASMRVDPIEDGLLMQGELRLSIAGAPSSSTPTSSR